MAHREGRDALLARLVEARPAPRRVLVFALYLLDPSEPVANLMRRQSRSKDEEVAYYALNYLARLCDQGALRQLSAKPYKVRASCEQWATTVAAFGTCRYTGASAFLVASLEHACGNVVAAAETGLRQL